MPGQAIRFSKTSQDQRLRPKLFGIGSAGCSIIEGAPLPTVAISTSASDLARSHADRKFLIGLDRLTGLSFTQADVMKKLPEVAGHELLDLFNNTDVAFLLCGLGGPTGSLGSRMVASIARAKGTAAIVLATTPFSAESFRRRELVSLVMGVLLESSTLVVEFDNDKLSLLAPNLPLSRAFRIMNGIMLRPVEDLCAVMSRQDLPSFLKIIGSATHGRFGLGLGRGDERVKNVVDEALRSPWFDYGLEQTSAAIAIYSASDPWDKEIEQVMGTLSAKLPSADLLWGSYSDPALADRIRLSVLLCKNKG